MTLKHTRPFSCFAEYLFSCTRGLGRQKKKGTVVSREMEKNFKKKLRPFSFYFPQADVFLSTFSPAFVQLIVVHVRKFLLAML